MAAQFVPRQSVGATRWRGLRRPQMTASSVRLERSIAVPTKMQEGSSRQLNWRTSIVDLPEPLELDSSLDARKLVAFELHYTGSIEDSATLNI
jgi:hypothetical protein